MEPWKSKNPYGPDIPNETVVIVKLACGIELRGPKNQFNCSFINQKTAPEGTTHIWLPGENSDYLAYEKHINGHYYQWLNDRWDEIEDPSLEDRLELRWFPSEPDDCVVEYRISEDQSGITNEPDLTEVMTEQAQKAIDEFFTENLFGSRLPPQKALNQLRVQINKMFGLHNMKIVNYVGMVSYINPEEPNKVKHLPLFFGASEMQKHFMLTFINRIQHSVGETHEETL